MTFSTAAARPDASSTRRQSPPDLHRTDVATRVRLNCDGVLLRYHEIYREALDEHFFELDVGERSWPLCGTRRQTVPLQPSTVSRAQGGVGDRYFVLQNSHCRTAVCPSRHQSNRLRRQRMSRQTAEIACRQGQLPAAASFQVYDEPRVHRRVLRVGRMRKTWAMLIAMSVPARIGNPGYRLGAARTRSTAYSANRTQPRVSKRTPLMLGFPP
jgi:hypothetical protein